MKRNLNDEDATQAGEELSRIRKAANPTDTPQARFLPTGPTEPNRGRRYILDSSS
jgi:hypothetical protein